jgi:broad specificity phosphatase PhoE
VDERHCLLLRHAETDANIENRFISDTDIGLNSYGRRQAEVMRAILDVRSFGRIVSSPTRRCIDTAKLLLTGVSAPPGIATDTRLCEVRAGALEGLLRSDTESSSLGDLLTAWEAEQNDWILANTRRWGGPENIPEPLADAQTRIRSVWEDLIARDEVRSSLLISHGTILRLLICDLLGIPRSRYRSLRINTCGYFDVMFTSGCGGVRLVALFPGPDIDS